MTALRQGGHCAVVGAGVAALAAARLLQAAGCGVTLFDKGRRWGGRLARRQTPHGVFEHGAPGAAAPAAWLKAAVASDGIAGLTLLTATPVTAVQALPQGWSVHTASSEPQRFDAVVITVPVPQLAPLLPDLVLPPAFNAVRYQPCWTLLCVPPAAAAPPHLGTDAPFASLRREASPPDQPARYTAHATAAWSEHWLESPPEAAATALWAALSARAGWQGQALWLQSHRWRYATVATPLGAPQWRLAPGLHYASDACLGGGLQGGLAAAIVSGEAAARALLCSP